VDEFVQHFNLLTGDVAVMVRLSVKEMRGIIAPLEELDAEWPETGPTVAWWAYDALTEDDVDQGKGPPLCLFRDDHFFVHLPYHIGEEFVASIKECLRI
jgi:hypothetical protein